MANGIDKPQLQDACTMPNKIFVVNEPCGAIWIDKSLIK
jgi:hypothetical protein